MAPNAIQAKLELAHLNLADTDAAMAVADATMRSAQKHFGRVLSQARGGLSPACIGPNPQGDSMAMTYDEVFEKMKVVLVDVLAVDEADVTPQA